MSKPFSGKILALLCILAYLASGYGYVHAAVWCFGVDGHTRYKVPAAGGCGPVTQAEKQADPAAPALAKPACCGPCLDIPTSFTARALSGKRLEAKLAPAAVSVASLLPARSPAAAALALPSRLPQPPPAANAPLTHLKTVVLLN
ncbi:hypothetical protein DESUT3_07600 [Desulfuromonas versatilis]|uniref:DUF2946 domain-containing protein n=1 Tax=Desulfuromonas versatilis TaxID=2802975 RepID=A0ABM8HPQ6_9BACT|nr:hypothetical protein [Desulfuromonas versatilis]BCR03691.1 hypothetical protein DESUT3_07600 [Desulfuromonas versatilis]